MINMVVGVIVPVVLRVWNACAYTLISTKPASAAGSQAVVSGKGTAPVCTRPTNPHTHVLVLLRVSATSQSPGAPGPVKRRQQRRDAVHLRSEIRIGLRALVGIFHIGMFYE